MQPAAPPAPRALCLLCPRWGPAGACCMGEMARCGGTRGRSAGRSSQRTRQWRASRRARWRCGLDLPARRRGEQAPSRPSPWPVGELRAGHLHGRPGQLDGGVREARVRWEAAGASGGAEDWRGEVRRGGSGGAGGCIAAQRTGEWMRIREEGEVRWRIKEGRGEIKKEK
jgi:hypothetical protein